MLRISTRVQSFTIGGMRSPEIWISKDVHSAERSWRTDTFEKGGGFIGTVNVSQGRFPSEKVY